MPLTMDNCCFEMTEEDMQHIGRWLYWESLYERIAKMQRRGLPGTMRPRKQVDMSQFKLLPYR